MPPPRSVGRSGMHAEAEVGIFDYATPDVGGVGGSLKLQPADFQVNELRASGLEVTLESCPLPEDAGVRPSRAMLAEEEGAEEGEGEEEWGEEEEWEEAEWEEWEDEEGEDDSAAYSRGYYSRFVLHKEVCKGRDHVVVGAASSIVTILAGLHRSK